MLVTQSCPTLCNSMDGSPPGSSDHGILQARIWEWVAIPFSGGSSWPRDRTQVCRTAGRFLPSVIPGKAAIQTMPPSEAVTASTGVTTQLYRWYVPVSSKGQWWNWKSFWETKHIILEVLGNYHTDKTKHSKKSFFQKLLKMVNGPLVNLGWTICVSYIIQETNGDGIDTPQFSKNSLVPLGLDF